MRTVWKTGSTLSLSLLALSLSVPARAFCGFSVSGNETEAPRSLAAAFQAQDWSRVESLLTDHVVFNYSGWEPSTAIGKRDVVLGLRKFDRRGRYEMSPGNTAHLIFSPMKLVSSHWVTSTATQVTQRPLDPSMFTDAPRLDYTATVAMMPDCEGKIRIILVIDNIVTAHG